MFKEFLTALLHKIITFLVSHKDLFEHSESEREKILEKLSVPEAFRTYLTKVSAPKFMKDIETVVLYLEDPKNTNITGNEFFKRFLEFLSKDLARKIDYMDTDYFLMRKEKRIEFIEKLIKGDSILASSLRGILVNHSYQQITEQVYALGNKTEKTPYIVVQSPREMDTELKKEIRSHLTKVWPLSLPTFQINRRLIGGLRVFVDGKTTDNSWLSRVLRYTSLTAN